MRSITRARTLATVAVVVGVLVSCGVEDEPAAASHTATPAPRESSVTPTTTPVVTTEIVTETEPIPFDTVERNDPDLEVGLTTVVIQGVKGTRTLTYEVELTDGVETARVLVDKEVTKAPVDEVIAVGTYEPPPPEPEPEPEPQPEPEPEADGKCDPNYSGGCVPIDSDVDCAGGSGNGPSYAVGPVRVVGADIYGLDSDNDGIGCE